MPSEAEFRAGTAARQQAQRRVAADVARAENIERAARAVRNAASGNDYQPRHSQ